MQPTPPLTGGNRSEGPSLSSAPAMAPAPTPAKPQAEGPSAVEQPRATDSDSHSDGPHPATKCLNRWMLKYGHVLPLIAVLACLGVAATLTIISQLAFDASVANRAPVTAVPDTPKPTGGWKPIPQNTTASPTTVAPSTLTPSVTNASTAAPATSSPPTNAPATSSPPTSPPTPSPSPKPS
jgi:hypothetical protein